MTKDINVDIARLQKEIVHQLGLESENVIFDFNSKKQVTKLDLITVNPRHEQSFLYHSVKAINKIEALEKMLNYVLEYHKSENSYTVQWIENGENQLHTSYFRAKNMYDAMDKFYYNRDINSYKIYSLVLNPVS